MLITVSQQPITRSMREDSVLSSTELVFSSMNSYRYDRGVSVMLCKKRSAADTNCGFFAKALPILSLCNSPGDNVIPKDPLSPLFEHVVYSGTVATD